MHHPDVGKGMVLTLKLNNILEKVKCEKLELFIISVISHKSWDYYHVGAIFNELWEMINSHGDGNFRVKNNSQHVK